MCAGQQIEKFLGRNGCITRCGTRPTSPVGPKEVIRPCISAFQGYDLVMTDRTFEQCSSLEMLDSLLQTIVTVHSRPSGRFVGA